MHLGKKNYSPFGAAIGFIVVMSFPLLSASEAGSVLSGRIADGSVPIAGAIVTVSNAEFLKSVTTDENGRFTLASLPPGRYDFRTSANGYAVFECSVLVRSGDARRNSVEVNNLIPADRQSVSIFELGAEKQTRTRMRRVTASRTGV